MRVRLVLWSVLVVAALVAGVAPAVAQAQQPLAGPAATVITTPDQQQALVTSLRTEPMMPYTSIQRLGRPVMVYADGREYVMIPQDEFIDNFRERGGYGRSSPPTEPESVELLDKDYSDLDPSRFVNVLEHITPIKNQSGRGMCHAFAATALLESLIKRRMMQRGVSEQLAEIDLSEEWFSLESMKHKSENGTIDELWDEGYWGYLDLEQVMDDDFVMEAYWPYEPASWPDTAGHPAAEDFADGEKCAWQWWGHREPGQKVPSSVGDFRSHVAPDGPMLSVRVESSRYTNDQDEGFALAKKEISEGRPVILGLVWPTLQLTNPQKTMYCVNEDYPFEAWEAKMGDGEMTQEQIDAWNAAYLGGHEVLLVGYGKPGTDCEGIWMVKNSHSLNSGNDGIVYITEGLIRLSFGDFSLGRLSDETRADVERFADTMLQQMDRM